MISASTIPVFDFDLFSDDGIAAPYDHYRRMRDMGPVVQLAAQDCLAVGRYADAMAVLKNECVFISGRGVALNDTFNAYTDSIITSDGERHAFMRKIEFEPVGPKALAELRASVKDTAEALVDDLITRGGTFDVVRDIASHIPLEIIMDLGGLPPVGRDNMLHWAETIFNLQGPMNARSEAALPALDAMLAYVTVEIDRNSVRPGSWAARAFRLADEKVIAPEMAVSLLLDFIGPSLDTTIAATGSLLLLLAQNPDQWRKLKAKRALVPNAINEALRIETPIRCFSRYVAEDAMIDGIAVSSGSRVATFFASANRDERFWDSPEKFSVERSNANQHIAFGAGNHQCIGNNLARLEMMAVVDALIDRVDYFEVGQPVYASNNLLRTLKSLPITLHI